MMDLEGKHIHLLGICGTGMSALAGLLQRKGAHVTGSDSQFYPPVGPMLNRMGVGLFVGYDAARISVKSDLFVVGNVVGRGNVEVEQLLSSGLPYESMAEALYRFILTGRIPVVVAGTHGKTTTTAFLAHLFSCGARDPGYFVAGNPLDLPRHYNLGTGEHFFVEGDEYETAFFDRSSKFLHYRPRDLLITALEHDHVDFFPEAGLYQKSFANLVNTVPKDGVIIYNRDYPMAREVMERAFSKTLSFGFSPSDGNGVQISVEAMDQKGMDFVIPWQGIDHHFHTLLLGRYNLLNLCAGILYGFHCGLNAATIQDAVATFHGVERRMTFLGGIEKTLFFEDFAHHPTAIASVIQAVRDAFPQKRVMTVLEPRSWSLRRNRFASSLHDALLKSDETWISEIYQKDKLEMSERLDVPALTQSLRQSGQAARTVADPVQIWDWLETMDCSADRVVLLLSNGAFGGLAQKIRDRCASGTVPAQTQPV